MQLVTDLAQTTIAGPTFLTIGNFDGLHRGHQVLLARVNELAHAYSAEGQSALLTFDPHPLAVLRPEVPLKLLTTPLERIQLAGEAGIDLGIIQRFSRAFAELSPADFMRLLKRTLGLAALVVGPDFALGRNRSGDLATLTRLGEEIGYEVHVLEPVDWQGKVVRSSIIRAHLDAGEVSEAANLLGRNYHLVGEVVVGDRRGHTIGFPTANLKIPDDKLLPANGVYATLARLEEVAGRPTFASATNIGVRPTVNGATLRIEPYLLDFPPPGHTGDLYGQTIHLEFVARLRGEQRFASLDALVTQIKEDVEATREIMSQGDSGVV